MSLDPFRRLVKGLKIACARDEMHPAAVAAYRWAIKEIQVAIHESEETDTGWQALYLIRCIAEHADKTQDTRELLSKIEQMRKAADEALREAESTKRPEQFFCPSCGGFRSVTIDEAGVCRDIMCDSRHVIATICRSEAEAKEEMEARLRANRKEVLAVLDTIKLRPVTEEKGQEP